MIGQRLYPDADGHYPWSTLAPGCFFKWDGHWYGKTPNDHLANLRNHQVTEHEDGTITVSPSICVSIQNDVEVWHGFLERGVWRSC